MPSSRATAVTVLPEESTSAIASRLNSSVYRFVYLLPTWRYFLWNLKIPVSRCPRSRGSFTLRTWTYGPSSSGCPAAGRSPQARDDRDGNVLDILVQNRRDKAAGRRFLRRLMTKTRAVPRVIVTDKLRSYSAAHREVMPSVGHRSHKRLNNRAENSHQPTRQRERVMKGFRSVGGAQRFLSAFSGISPTSGLAAT